MATRTRVIKELREVDPEWVAFVDRGANRTGRMVLKADGAAAEEPAGGDGMLARVMKGVLAAFGAGAGGAAEPPALLASQVHTLVFDVEKWDGETAAAWARERGVNVAKAERTEEFLHLSTGLDDGGAAMRTAHLGDGVAATYVEKIEAQPMPTPRPVTFPAGGPAPMARTPTVPTPTSTMAPAPAREVVDVGAGGDNPARHTRSDHPPLATGGDTPASQTRGSHEAPPPAQPRINPHPTIGSARYDASKAESVAGAIAQLGEVVRQVFQDAAVVNKADALRPELFAFNRALVRCARKQADAAAQEDPMTTEQFDVFSKKMDDIGTGVTEIKDRVAKLEADVVRKGDMPAFLKEKLKGKDGEDDEDKDGEGCAKGEGAAGGEKVAKADSLDQRMEQVLREVTSIGGRISSLESGGGRVAVRKSQGLEHRTPTLEEGLAPGRRSGERSGLFDDLFFARRAS